MSVEKLKINKEQGEALSYIMGIEVACCAFEEMPTLGVEMLREKFGLALKLLREVSDELKSKHIEEVP